MAAKQKALILGGGFGGIKTALELAKDDGFEVTLLSDQTDFRYYPQLYHAATGGSHFATNIPLSEIFAEKNVRVVHDRADKLNRETKHIVGQSGKAYGYDVLVVALGVVTNFFGIKGLEEHAYGIKSLAEARRFRQHLHKLLVEKHRPDINYVVIGGGPTGVELAGALPAYIRQIMKNHGFVGDVHVDLVEAAPRLVSRMPARYSKAIAKRLRKLGVKLYLGETVEAETAAGLMVSGHPIDSHSVVWTAGVTNHPFFKANGFNISEHGKVVVDKHLSAEPGIYVIGDNADTEYSGLAQTALRDGLYVADNLRRQMHGRKLRSYIPKRPIYVMPVGPGWAAVLWGKFQITGRLGWWLRSAADFIAYRDVEPWWPAGKHWAATMDRESDCPICAKK